MITSVEAPKTQFLISNLSLPKALLLGGSVAAYEHYMHATGADGLEVTPVHSRFMDRVLQRAAMTQDLPAHREVLESQDDFLNGARIEDRHDWTYEDGAFRELVRSQHSSFRNDEGDNGLVARAFPSWKQSLEQMRRVQIVTGKLPGVLYPGFRGSQVVYTDENAPFAQRTFQPKPLEWRRMALQENSSIEDIKTVMGQRGFTGVTYDLLHCQVEEAGERFRDPLGLALRLAGAGLVNAVHLSVNRLDITGFGSRLARTTRGARKAFVHSAATAAQTLEGEILVGIAGAWRQNRDDEGGAPLNTPNYIVLEDGPLRIGRVTKDHAAMIANARELIAAGI
jgi:hypothetical protein